MSTLYRRYVNRLNHKIDLFLGRIVMLIRYNKELYVSKQTPSYMPTKEHLTILQWIFVKCIIKQQLEKIKKLVWDTWWNDRTIIEVIDTNPKYPSGNPWPITPEDFKLHNKNLLDTLKVCKSIFRHNSMQENIVNSIVSSSGFSGVSIEYDMRIHRRIIRTANIIKDCIYLWNVHRSAYYSINTGISLIGNHKHKYVSCLQYSKGQLTHLNGKLIRTDVRNSDIFTPL